MIEDACPFANLFVIVEPSLEEPEYHRGIEC